MTVYTAHGSERGGGGSVTACNFLHFVLYQCKCRLFSLFCNGKYRSMENLNYDSNISIINCIMSIHTRKLRYVDSVMAVCLSNSFLCLSQNAIHSRAPLTLARLRKFLIWVFGRGTLTWAYYFPRFPSLCFKFTWCINGLANYQCNSLDHMTITG